MLMHAMGHSEHGEHNVEPRTGTLAVESPAEILRRRFALGEIGREQFEEISRVLSRADSGALQDSSPHTDRHW
jgi:uncharacterized membrane protein